MRFLWRHAVSRPHGRVSRTVVSMSLSGLLPFMRSKRYAGRFLLMTGQRRSVGGDTRRVLIRMRSPLHGERYKEKHPNLADEVDGWDDVSFLARTKVCIRNQITNAAIVLLGKSRTEHLLSPAIAHITWVLKDKDEIEVDYAHFGPPLILAVDRVFDKIRNLTIRYIPGETLFPQEVTQYDP